MKYSSERMFQATVYGFCKGECIPSILYTLSYYMCYLNSSGNPFAYALANRQFRSAFIRMLKGNFNTVVWTICANSVRCCVLPLSSSVSFAISSARFIKRISPLPIENKIIKASFPYQIFQLFTFKSSSVITFVESLTIELIVFADVLSTLLHSASQPRVSFHCFLCWIFYYPLYNDLP